MTTSVYSRVMAGVPIGELIRRWRVRRHRSQLELSIDVGVSTRHLSFVETGRSRPSPELVLAIAQYLEVPLRERNSLLLAAGYAPRFSHVTLDDPAMATVLTSVQRMLDAHDPHPGVVLDRQWNVVLANRAALLLTVGIPAHLLGPPMNVYRLSLHPDGLAARTTNFRDWAGVLIGQLRRSIVLTGDPSLEALHIEVMAYPGVAQISEIIEARLGDEPPLLIPFRFATPLGEVSMFTTLTTFGTPRDVTLEELTIELFFPADDESADKVREIGRLSRQSGEVAGDVVATADVA